MDSTNSNSEEKGEISLTTSRSVYLTNYPLKTTSRKEKEVRHVAHMDEKRNSVRIVRRK
jgi:hypothetical protein